MYKLIGFKVGRDEHNNVKWYQLFFIRDVKENRENEYGNICKSFLVYPPQLNGVEILVGAYYNVFSAYSSQEKRELFAGIQYLGKDEK